jgi:HlyD family secretion protein
MNVCPSKRSQIRATCKLDHFARLAFARRHLGSLELRAPVSGTLSSLDAQVGQSLAQGQRAGQIDVAGDFKVVAKVDQFYADRIAVGRAAHMVVGDRQHELAVAKIYPLVDGGRFTVDLTFTGAAPADLRRGQVLPFRITLGETTQSIVAPSGGFLDDSGGRYAFVLTADGSRAVRRDIQIGRKTPQQVEILRGLAAGERIVTSSYQTYRDITELVLE